MNYDRLDDFFFLGIDGGGTKCRARLESADGTILGVGFGGSSNPSHGMSVATKSILTAVESAMLQANLPQSAIKKMVVGAGLAGLHLPKYRKLIDDWQHPFYALYTTDDLHVASLGAHNGKDGAVIIAGTGFSALSIVNNQKTAIGGYGFLQGDYCSGSWIGYQAIQSVLLAHDYLEESTMLTELIFNKYQANGIELANLLVDAKAAEYGALAPLVFQAVQSGDVIAKRIISQSCEFLSRVIQQIAKSNPPRISLVGGTAEQLINYLSTDVVQLLTRPIDTPEYGAICFARHQYLKQVSER